MSVSERLNGFAGDDWVRQERIVREFEEAWQLGPRPDLEEYLLRGPGLGGLLLELIHVDLEFRHRDGEPAVVEEYLRCYPQLAEDRAAVFGLYDAERDVRRLGSLESPRPGAPCQTEPEGRTAPSGTASTGLLSPVPERLGKFRLRRELGAGAFGTVYLADDIELRRPVALKVLHRQGGPWPDRLLRGAQTASQLRHPAIAAIYEAGQDQGFAYLASEYVPGQTLAHRLHDGPLPPRVAADLLAQVAEALDYAHRMGVVHRDVKPSNIQLDPEGRPHLLDFGLARWDAGDGTLTRDGELLGTLAYMSPEQARGDASRVDGRADVYSLGVVLYQTLTGALPFSGESPSVLRQIREEEPAPPRRLERALPRDLEKVCLKTLAKQPADRYPTATALADDLRRFLDGTPVRARAIGPLGRTRRWCQRNPMPAGLGALLVVALLGVGWQWRRAEANLADAHREAHRAEENFQQARQAVDDFAAIAWADTSGGLLPADIVAVRQAEVIQKYYLTFLEQRGDDPGLRAEVARALLLKAQVYQSRGTLEEQYANRDVYHRSLALYEQLARESPDRLDYSYALASVHLGLGEFHLERMQFAEAEKHLSRARELFADLRPHLSAVEAQTRLAQSHRHLGWLRHQQGRHEDALRQLLQAEKHQGEVVRRTSDLVPRFEMVWIEYLLGIVQRDRGEPGAAHEAHHRALALCDPLARHYPASVSIRLMRGRNLYMLARAAAELGRLDEALRNYREAAVAFARCAEDDPNHPYYRRDLAACLHNLGNLHRQGERWSEAVQNYRQALAAREKLIVDAPTHLGFLSDWSGTAFNLAEVLERLGDRDGARALFRQALDRERQVALKRPGDPACRERLAAREQALARLRQVSRENGTAP